jgi:hypothetical protein
VVPQGPLVSRQRGPSCHSASPFSFPTMMSRLGLELQREPGAEESTSVSHTVRHTARRYYKTRTGRGLLALWSAPRFRRRR